MKFLALAWDLDGTLADTADDLTASLNHLRVLEGLAPLAVAEVRHLVGDGAAMLVRRGLSPVDEEAQARYVRQFLEHYRDHCCDHAVLMPGALETLDALTELPQAIATNKPMEYTEPILRHLGVEGRFAAVYGAGSVPNRKPHPDMILAIAAQLGVPPFSILMIGDSANDIRSARAAGAKSCAVSGGYKTIEELRPENPDYTVEHLRDIVDLVKGA